VFDPYTFLTQTGPGKTIQRFKKNVTIFTQGDAATSVFYIRKGRVKLTVVSEQGKEATLALLGIGDFLGESCIAGQATQGTTAKTIVETTVLRIDGKEMIRVLHEELRLSELFVSYLLSRHIRTQEDLVDQLFNCGEKRLARVLLLLAHFGKDDDSGIILPRLSQQTLASMIGTTRQRVNVFLRRFEKLGYIEHKGGLRIKGSLLKLVVHG
jgi:CRP-like cAMP-binding protein